MVVGVGEKLRRPVKGHVQGDQKVALTRSEDHREFQSLSLIPSIHHPATAGIKLHVKFYVRVFYEDEYDDEP